MTVLISECLLGREVRYDGKSKPARLPRWFSGAEVKVVAFCPETAAGFGVPRPAIELVDGGRIARVCDRADVTAPLTEACEKELARLEATGAAPDVIVLKARSPSCGVESPLHDNTGAEIGKVPGLWAAMLRRRFPAARVFTEETLPEDL